MDDDLVVVEQGSISSPDKYSCHAAYLQIQFIATFKFIVDFTLVQKKFKTSALLFLRRPIIGNSGREKSNIVFFSS